MIFFLTDYKCCYLNQKKRRSIAGKINKLNLAFAVKKSFYATYEFKCSIITIQNISFSVNKKKKKNDRNKTLVLFSISSNVSILKLHPS